MLETIKNLSEYSGLIIAIAAVVTIYITSRSHRRNDRSYIFAKRAIIICEKDEDGNSYDEYIRVELHNYGNTPAYDLRYNLMISVEDSDFSNFKETSDTKKRAAPLPQKQSMYLDRFFPGLGGADQVSRIISGEKKIFAYGTIKYHDAFREEHYTVFKFELNIDSEFPATVDFDLCQSGNIAS